MNVPKDLKYTKDHEWVKIEGDIAIIGITDFAQGELGDIVYVEVDTLDETLQKEEVFGTPPIDYETALNKACKDRVIDSEDHPVYKNAGSIVENQFVKKVKKGVIKS